MTGPADLSAAGSAGAAYLVWPDERPAPGVLVLHSWWGLTQPVKSVCDRLADAGFVALAPDLLGGRIPADEAEASAVLAATDPNETAALILSSVVALRTQIAEPGGPIGVIGFSMGASWALWLATRQPGSVAAAVAYYGSQNIDFDGLDAPVQVHLAEEDHIIDQDEVVEMVASMRLIDKDLEVHFYPEAGHFFAEEGQPAYEPESAAVAWARTVEFLDDLLSDGGLTA